MGAQALSETEMMEMAMETRRRRDAIVTGGTNTLDDGGFCASPFENESQQFVMINMANVTLRPHSDFPAFRVLGFFGSPAELISHVPAISLADASTCDIRMVTSREFYSIPVARDGALEDQQAKVNRNLMLHQQQLQFEVTEFVDHKTNLTKGRVPVNMQADTVEDAVARMARNKHLPIIETGTSAAVHVTTEVPLLPQPPSPPIKSRSVTLGDDDDGGVSESKGECFLFSSPSSPKGRGQSMGAGAGVCNGNADVVAKCGDGGSVPEVMIGLERALFLDTSEEVASSVFENVSMSVEVPVPVPVLLSGGELRNQRFASLALLKDYESGTEPSVCFLGGFASQDEAIAFNKYVASKYIEDHDLHVVEMYVWVYPHLVLVKEFDSVEQVYRNKEQDGIMRQQRTCATKVDDFTRFFESRGLPVPAVEVSPDI